MTNMNKVQKKNTGSFYTCKSIAEYLSSWAIDSETDIVLEPSFGDGSFIDEVLNIFKKRNIPASNLIGVELQNEPYNIIKNKYPDVRLHLNDFMCFKTKEKIHAVIGNPPYVSLKNVDDIGRANANKTMSGYKYDLSKTSSMWLPFIVHSAELLDVNGKIGFVLPYEMTYVNYSFNLWNYLKKNFGKISIYRVHEDFFPDVEVETILFLAEEKGKTTREVCYKIFDSVDDLFKNQSVVNTRVTIDSIVNRNKPFEEALLTDGAQTVIARLNKEKKLHLMKDECKFKIGYVCGNKHFFHPTNEIIRKYKIPKSDLLPCLINSKDTKAIQKDGLELKMHNGGSKLFYPSSDNISKYVKYGESLGLQNGYKCKRRKPWFRTPDVKAPDLVLTVFGNVPTLLDNGCGYAISNSLLAGTMSKGVDKKNLVCRWYNSLTLLFIELTIHSLGGGTLVLIPGETDMLKILKPIPSELVDTCFEKLNACYKEKGIEKTYTLGDELVLKEIYNFTDSEIDEIRKSLLVLKNWRIPETRRK